MGSGTVAPSRRPIAARASPPARDDRLKRRARTALHAPGYVAHDQRKPRVRLATPRRLQTVTEYSLWGFLTIEGTLFRGLTDQGFEAWPTKDSTGAPNQQSQGLHG
jgi:hypothetical protein